MCMSRRLLCALCVVCDSQRRRVRSARAAPLAQRAARRVSWPQGATRDRDARSLIGVRARRDGAKGRAGGSGVPCGVPVTLWGCMPCLKYTLGPALGASDRSRDLVSVYNFHLYAKYGHNTQCVKRDMVPQCGVRLHSSAHRDTAATCALSQGVATAPRRGWPSPPLSKFRCKVGGPIYLYREMS